jgi:murein DD-endopeptidase MepM/ murein hydrolase activator NlpD
MGERLTIPGSASRLAARPAPIAQHQPAPAAPQPRIAELQTPPQVPNTARTITPEKTDPVESTKEDAGGQGSSSGPGFRWPVRGRVIAGFGPKPTGQQNDGINIAVPEGTPVKASEDGVVAYAGNELKGYGNLVLVRHPNGHVTAYAHASELLVKRGDNVKRGQVIAKSGQTGSVSSPQLHFEIRKGATPVDPMQFLTGAS